MAGRQCTICEHPERGSIETEVLAHKGSERAIASRWGVNRASLQRHTQNHIPKEHREALVEVEARADAALTRTVAHSASLVLSAEQRVEAALAPVARAVDALDRLATDPSISVETMLKAYAELGKMAKVALEHNRTRAQLTGELSTVTTQVAVINSAADFLASPALPAETARAQQACADAVLSAWKDAVTRLGTAEDYQEADAEGLRRLDAKIAELSGGVSGKGGRR